MTQSSDQKPAPASQPEGAAGQPASTELSAEELDRATGGDKAQTTTQTSSIQITKLVDKASPILF